MKIDSGFGCKLREAEMWGVDQLYEGWVVDVDLALGVGLVEHDLECGLYVEINVVVDLSDSEFSRGGVKDSFDVELASDSSGYFQDGIDLFEGLWFVGGWESIVLDGIAYGSKQIVVDYGDAHILVLDKADFLVGIDVVMTFWFISCNCS